MPANIAGTFPIFSTSTKSPPMTTVCTEQRGQDDTDDCRCAIPVEAEHLKRGLQVECRQHVISNRIGEDNQYGENHAQPSCVQRISHAQNAGPGSWSRPHSSSFCRSASVDSMKADAPPKKALSHIQKIAPAPAADYRRCHTDITGTNSGCGGYHQRPGRMKCRSPSSAFP